MKRSSSKLPSFYLDGTLIFIAVFVVALLLRVIFVIQWDGTPYGQSPLLDARAYDDWAQDVAKGHLLRPRAFYQSPLYPYLLGLLYAFCGHRLLIAGLFNALLSALTPAVLSAVSFSLFGVGAALVTGLLAAFYVPLIFYTVPAMKEPLGLLLLALALVFVLRGLRENRIRDWFWCGALLGLDALVRGNALLLAPIVLALGAIRWRRGFLKNGAALIGTMLLFIMPATIHNYVVSGEFVPIAYDDGFNFYIGHSPTANGTNDYPPEISTDPQQEELATMWEARTALGRDIGPAEVSAFWRGRAADFIMHNPGRELVLLKNKFLAFWNTAETFDVYDISFIRKNFRTVISWAPVTFWPIVVLAAFGAVAAWREKREAVTILGTLTLAYMGSVLLFYVTDRYRLPVVIFLLPLAGAALPCGWRLVREKKWRFLAGATVTAFAFLLLCVRPPSDAVDLTAFDWGTLSGIYSDESRGQDTIDAMHKALSTPGDPSAQAFIRGAFVEQARGRNDEAERLLKAAVQYYPADGIVLYNYGRLKAMEGDLPAARDAFQKAIPLTPSYVLNYYGLAQVDAKLGDHAQALAALHRGLAVSPSDPLLLQMLKQVGGK
jgi:tetratricopeptide (TPR) repeat protein